LIRNQASLVVQTHQQLLPPAEIGTAYMEISMELNQLSSAQIMAVLQNIHEYASKLNEEFDMEYNDALVKAFHDLWTATEN
jgi:hypothetical protein